MKRIKQSECAECKELAEGVVVAGHDHRILTISEIIDQQDQNLKELIFEWNSYLPEIKKQSIDTLIDEIRDVLN